MDNIITGIDIGGTHITVCKVDLTDMKVIETTRVRHEIDTTLSKEEVMGAWAMAIKTCAENYNDEIGKIGIAMPGPFDYENGVSLITGLHKYESLYGQNVKEMLAAALHIPAPHILMMNDATAFLLGEWKAGAGKGCNHLIGITLGTGFGSAFGLNNTLTDGDLWCFPYKNGRAEDVLCARWLVNTYNNRTDKQVDHVKELAKRAETDAVALTVFREFGNTLGSVLVQRFADNFPEHIVVSGNISKAFHLIQPACEEVLHTHGISCTMLPAVLGEDAALIGAAYLWEG